MRYCSSLTGNTMHSFDLSISLISSSSLWKSASLFSTSRYSRFSPSRAYLFGECGSVLAISKWYGFSCAMCRAKALLSPSLALQNTATSKMSLARVRSACADGVSLPPGSSIAVVQRVSIHYSAISHAVSGVTSCKIF
jgi:hypothetical protein